VERAKTIIDEMAARGLRRDDFLYRGLGGDEPVASNETEAGRARNRRVEVIILD
jgi:outer membrane protein OmpA-like peptidoglycan-associated protein